MKGLLIFAIVAVSYNTIIETQTWPAWEVCSSGCYWRRSITCDINGISTTGLQCVDVNIIYQQELQNGCTTTNCGQQTAMSTGSCLGNCYDASKEQTNQCSNQVGCNILYKIRCYSEATCSGTWKQISQNCSKPCGGGKTTNYQKCYSGNSPSYNCKGTGGNINYVDVQTGGDCNTEVCPTWSSWTSSTSCSKTCGGGSRTLNSSCTYNNQPSFLCGDNKTSRTKSVPCNTKSCTTTVPTTTTTASSTTKSIISSTTTLATTRTTNTPLSSTTTKRSTITTKLQTESTNLQSSTLGLTGTLLTTNITNKTTGAPYNDRENLVMYFGVGAGGGVVFIISIMVIVVVCQRKRKHSPTDNQGAMKPGLKRHSVSDASSNDTRITLSPPVHVYKDCTKLNNQTMKVTKAGRELTDEDGYVQPNQLRLNDKENKSYNESAMYDDGYVRPNELRLNANHYNGSNVSAMYEDLNNGPGRKEDRNYEIISP